MHTSLATQVIQSAVNPLSADFQANDAEMKRLIEHLRETMAETQKGAGLQEVPAGIYLASVTVAHRGARELSACGNLTPL